MPTRYLSIKWAEAIPCPTVVMLVTLLAFGSLPVVAQPNLISTVPARNAFTVPRSSNVTLTFGQAIAPSTVANIRVFSSQVRGLRGGAYFLSGPSTISFNPTQDFVPGEQVTVTVPTTVQNTSGVGVQPYVYQFTAATAPSTGVFTSAPDITAPRGTYNVVAGDINNDGHQDLVTGNIFNRNASVWLGNGQGGFLPGTTVPLSGSPPTALLLADLNNDSKLDLVAPTGNSNIINVRLGDGQGAFTGSTDIVVSAPWQVAAADLNKDGNLDLICGYNYSFGVNTLLGDGLGNFSPGPSFSDPILRVGSFDVTDVNNDGNVDVLVTNVSTNGVFDNVDVLLGDGQAQFTLGRSYGVVVDRLPTRVIGADFNNDGNMDMACATYSTGVTGSVSVRFNNGMGRLIGTTNITVGNYPKDVHAVDIEGDGDLDLLTTNYVDNTVSIRLNDGFGNFSGTGTMALSATGEPASMAMADFNGDGTLDFAVVDQRSYTVRIRLNGAQPLASTPAEKPQYSVAAYPNPGKLNTPVTVALPAYGYGTKAVLVRITDVVGRTIFSQRLPSTSQGSLALPAATFKTLGTYLITVAGAEQVSNARIIITE